MEVRVRNGNRISLRFEMRGFVKMTTTFMTIFIISCLLSAGALMMVLARDEQLATFSSDCGCGRKQNDLCKTCGDAQ